MRKVYTGQISCEGILKSGKPCKNKAYWETPSGYRCGVHSQKQSRSELPKDPNAGKKKEKALEERCQSIERARRQNLKRGELGQVTSSKLQMRKEAPYLSGFQSVFPNFKHGNRKDGLGMPELSPMSLGPVKHRMPDIPEAKNIENFHQGSKFFAHELDDEGEPTEEALDFRDEFFEDSEPHRHKFDKKDLPKENRRKAGGTESSSNRNIPEFSMMVDQDGVERKFNYYQSRWFYSVWYQYLAEKTESFADLLELMEDGVNLNLIGYDGYSLPEDGDLLEVLNAAYRDTSRPFGHELVLMTMLLLDDPELYPWNRYAAKHLKLYSGFWNPNLKKYM